MTANAGAEMEQVYRQEGFDGYLAKPVRGASLKGELARLVGMQAKEGCGA
jgi:CheY-like chemotaxis protein